MKRVDMCPITIKKLEKGDIVLIKEVNTKLQHYPMGIVKDVMTNENGEVTGATVLKGRTREITKRHASTLIPILTERNASKDENLSSVDSLEPTPEPVEPKRGKRVAAQRVKELVQRISNENLI